MSGPSYIPTHQTDPYTFGKGNMGAGLGKAVKKAVGLKAGAYAAKESDKLAKRKGALKGWEDIQKVGSKAGPSSLRRDRPAATQTATTSYYGKPSIRAGRRVSAAQGAPGASKPGVAPRRVSSSASGTQFGSL